MAFLVLANFFAIYSSLIVSNSKNLIHIYEFEKTQQIYDLSSTYSKVGVAEDGTIIKRVIFQGVISDFIVRFINNVTVFIPLNKELVSKLKGVEFEEKANIFFGKISKIVKQSWKLSVCILTILIFVCASEEAIVRKRKELLAVIARTRSDVWYNTFCLKTS